MIRTWTCCLICLCLLFPGGALRGEGKIRVLLLDGQNNHNWVETSESLRGALERAGLFQVVTSTSPPKEAAPGDWKEWRPDFGAADVVVSNYNGQAWPKAVEEALEEYVRSGGGLAIVHAANNPFPEWEEYNRMIGLGWRDRDYGDAIAVDDAGGHLLRIPAGAGIGAGHGRRHSYLVRIRKPEHPIMKGIPSRWMHATDELYHGQRGPAMDMTVSGVRLFGPEASRVRAARAAGLGDSLRAGPGGHQSDGASLDRTGAPELTALRGFPDHIHPERRVVGQGSGHRSRA